MDIKVYPSAVGGEILIPPSKSDSHRAYICSILAGGKTPERLGRSMDIEATKNGMKQILSDKKNITVDCGESGSTLRFLIPLALAFGHDAVFTGKESLMRRPQTVYEKLFAEKGIEFSQNGNEIHLSGRLSHGVYRVDGNVSSQFITGLLLALPLLGGESQIIVNPPFASRPYVDMTMATMASYGIAPKFKDEFTIQVPKGEYKDTDYTVEADYSQAAFFGVLGTLCGKLKLKGLKKDSLQGDKAFIEMINSAGGNIKWENDILSVEKAALRRADFDIGDCPDLGPVLMVAAAFCDEGGIIRNTNRLKIKESDRAQAMTDELTALNVPIKAGENEIIVGRRQKNPNGIAVKTYNDHRIAMSLSVFGAAAENAVIIKNAECVAKSYPEFFEDIASVQVKTEAVQSKGE